MPRERDPNHVPVVPAKVKVAIAFMVEHKDDMAAAALHAGIHIHELRRSMSKAHVLNYARAQKKLAIEALCLSSPAHLADVLKSENQMARVNAIKTAEALRLDAVELDQRSVQRQPGLQIVIVQRDGGQQVAYQPAAMLEVEVVPAPEPVPATRPDAEAE